jgi:hypothetical protein
MKYAVGIVICLILTISIHERHVIACMAASSLLYEEIAPRVYAPPGFDPAAATEIMRSIASARSRIESKFGPLSAVPRIILARSQEDAAAFGVPPAAPGTPYALPWGSYIALAPDGQNVDVVAHELVHAEIAERVGYTVYCFGLPAWFNEGMAMQVDLRKQKIWRYIEDGVALPPVSTLESRGDFYTGDQALHYAAAQVEGASWLAAGDGGGDLYGFLDVLAGGADFEESYHQHSLGGQ